MLEKPGSFHQGYALIIGIANYRYVRNLPSVILNDVEDLYSLLKDPDHCGYPKEQIQCIVDAKATAAGIRSGINWLLESTTEKDTAIFYFSGHGGRLANTQDEINYILPHDTVLQDLANTAISGQELTNLLQQIKANRLLVIFDSCHAGGIGEIKGDTPLALANFKAGLHENLYEQLGYGKGRAIIAAARSDEYSWILPDLNNSLFTHYLLQALRGKGPTQRDGVIRLFDLYDYISQKVGQHHANQHPVLKAKLENNFPIALESGGKYISQQLAPDANNYPIIQRFNISLTPLEEEALKQLFLGYKRLVLKTEFGGGFSGGRVFIVRPIRPESAELPAVVKTGPASLIRKEWEAYSLLVDKKVPKVARIEGKPAYTQSQDWAGIRYPLAGNGHFYTETFKQFCMHADVEELNYLLTERLFPSMEAMWQSEYSKMRVEVHLGSTFDPVLPVNFVIQIDPNAKQQKAISPQNVHNVVVEVGDKIEISRFVVTKVDPSNQEVTLSSSFPDPQSPPNSYRLRLIGVENTDAYQEGKPLQHSLRGSVTLTRQSALNEELKRVFDIEIVETSEEILLPVGIVPNPIAYLPKLLNQSQDLRFSSIHGDLNLENILVEFDQVSRDIHLIDFASARIDYVLHDLLRLETSIWLYVVSEEIAKNQHSLSVIKDLSYALHTPEMVLIQHLQQSFQLLSSIRKMAKPLQKRTNNWDEYYEGLIVYLVGSLKFKNLDFHSLQPLPKQVAVTVAALLCKILLNPKTPQELTRDYSLVDSQVASTELNHNNSNLRLVFDQAGTDFFVSAYSPQTHKPLVGKILYHYLKELAHLIQSREQLPAKIVGNVLYTATLTKVQQIIRNHLNDNNIPNASLILDFSNAPSLQTFPWEMLNDGTKFLTERVIRFSGNYLATFPITDSPLKILITTEGSATNWRQKARNLEKFLNQITKDLEIVVRPGLAKDGLLHALGLAHNRKAPFHIWHHLTALTEQDDEGIAFSSSSRLEFTDLGEDIKKKGFAIPLICLELEQSKRLNAAPLFQEAAHFPATSFLVYFHDDTGSPLCNFITNFYEKLFDNTLHQAFSFAFRQFIQYQPVDMSPFLLTSDVNNTQAFWQRKISETSASQSSSQNIKMQFDDIKAGKAIFIGKLGRSEDNIQVDVVTNKIEADLVGSVGSIDEIEYLNKLLDFLKDVGE